MLLLSRLESLRADRLKRVRGVSEIYLNGENAIPLYEYTEAAIKKDRDKMLAAYKDSSILDSSGEFHIINHFMRAQSLGPRNHIREDVGLVTQSSLAQLHHLPLLSKRWNGLISLGVFALSTDINLVIETILMLRRCHPMVRYNTSFHLVYPLRAPLPLIGALSTRRPSVQSVADVTCVRVDTVFDSLVASAINYDHSGVPYPNNLLRNVARRSVLTEFVFVIDIDLVMNRGLRADFVNFAKDSNLFRESQKTDKNVYVVPAYEVRGDLPDTRIPEDKTALLELISLTEARPFYFDLCWKCQKHTDYETWQREPKAAKLAALYEVLWRDPWEPFYIGRNSAPFYDERFRQYGFNRISQVRVRVVRATAFCGTR